MSEGVNRTVDVGRDVLDTPRPEISSVLLLLFDDVVESICLTTNRFGFGERERERERERNVILLVRIVYDPPCGV